MIMGLSEKSGKVVKIKQVNFITATSLTDFLNRKVSMIVFFNLCHENDNSYVNGDASQARVNS